MRRHPPTVVTLPGRRLPHRPLAGLAAVALLAAGCTGVRHWSHNGHKVGPDYCRPAAAVAEQWIDAADEGVSTDTDDYSHWWTAFDDPVLNSLVYDAYRQNLPLRVAGLRILEARAQRGIAAGNLFPQVQEAFGDYARVQTSGNVHNQRLLDKHFDAWDVGFNAAWELDFWGRFRRGVEAADADLSAQAEDYDDVLVILQAEVAANYVQLRTFEQRLALAEENVKLQQRTLDIANVRYAGGDGNVSELDPKQAEANLAATRSLIPPLVAGRRRTVNRLCILLGLPPHDLEAELPGPGAIPSTPAEVVVGIPAELLRRRPDVRRAERQLAAQSARIGIATAELYPRIAITGLISLDSDHFAELFDSGSVAGSIGPSFRWNILNYGRIRNNIRVEDARFRQLAVAYQEAVLRANEEVENGIVDFLQEQLRAKSLGQSVVAVQRVVELATVQYRNPVAKDVDYFQRLVSAQRLLVQHQDALAASRGKVALNLIAVYKALGGGWRMRYQPELESGLASAVSDPGAGDLPGRVPTAAGK